MCVFVIVNYPGYVCSLSVIIHYTHIKHCSPVEQWQSNMLWHTSINGALKLKMTGEDQKDVVKNEDRNAEEEGGIGRGFNSQLTQEFNLIPSQQELRPTFSVAI